MKIKRYQANDMRTAIKIVREELGSDAVILSNQRIDGRTEVIAAIDYDESLLVDTSVSHPEASKNNFSQSEYESDLKYTRKLPENNTAEKVTPEKLLVTEQFEKKIINEIESKLAERIEINTKENQSLLNNQKNLDVNSQLNELRSMLLTQFSGPINNELKSHPLREVIRDRLIGFGLSKLLASSLANKTDVSDSFEYAWRHALALLAHKIKVTNDGLLVKGGIVALIGATGVGKTTTVAKIAAQYILRHGGGSVALISTDNYRVAAHEQLRTFSRILNVPMYIATDIKQLKSVLNVVHDKKLILIDTAGLNATEIEFCNKFKTITTPRKIKIHLVHAVNTQYAVQLDVSNAVKCLNIEANILTKLDETTCLGGSLSVCIENNTAISYFSDGQKIPEDLHLALSHTLVSRNISIMQETVVNNKKKIPLYFKSTVNHAHG